MRIVPSLFLIAFLASCSLQAKLTLDPSGSAMVETSFAVPGPTKTAWSHLRDLDPTLPADPLDPALLSSGLGGQARVTTTFEGTLLTFPIADPKKFFPGWRNESGSWSLVLDRAAVRRLISLTSWAGSPAVESLLPAPEAKVTEADYRDLLVYLLGPDASETAARKLVDDATVQLTIVAPRPLKSAEGSRSFVGQTAVYRWPLIRMLTLERPIVLRLTF